MRNDLSIRPAARRAAPDRPHGRALRTHPRPGAALGSGAQRTYSSDISEAS
jgi:hypothetical protein